MKKAVWDDIILYNCPVNGVSLTLCPRVRRLCRHWGNVWKFAAKAVPKVEWMSAKADRGISMEKIAIVEDTKAEKETLTAYLERYKTVKNETFVWKYFDSAFDFLESRENFDIVFMDIMLPGMTGMEAAQKLRRFNSDIIIIFVTNMTSFAVKSYEVDALDYIVKPVSYERVDFKLTKALGMIRAKGEVSLVINDSEEGIVRISSGQLYYIEVTGHRLRYCTDKGDFYEYGTLSKRADELSGYNFARCNACYLVNLRYIFSVSGYSLVMKNGDELKISQPKKKEFMEKLANFMGQGKC